MLGNVNNRCRILTGSEFIKTNKKYKLHNTNSSKRNSQQLKQLNALKYPI